MENATNPVITQACDCTCPVHHGQPRRRLRDDGCQCAIGCSSQPITLLVREWASALFLTGDGDLWLVNPEDASPQGADVLSPSEPYRAGWDWGNAGPIPEHHESYQTGKVIAALLRQLAATIAPDGAGEPPPTPHTGEGVMPAIRYTAVIQDGTSADDLIPAMIVFGHTEDEVYQGIFTTIAEWIAAGEFHDTPGWWLEEHPIAGVRVTEPGAAQKWLERLSEHTTILYWTVLEHESLLDMRQPPRHGQ